MRRKVGIMGGTFDPIHIGHLILGESAWEQFALEKVLFMPSGNPPHKRDRSGGAANEQRVEMVRLAVVDNPHFSLSLEEMHEMGYIYTSKTLQRLTEKNPDTDYYFIMGADSFINVEKWYKGEELLEEFGFIVSSRPGYPEKELESKMKFYKMDYDTKIIRLMTKMPDISSTEIRETALAGESIRHLVPAVVEKYIQINGLYDDMIRNPRWKLDQY